MIYNTKYGQPQDVVFAGQLYTITIVPPQHLIDNKIEFSQAVVSTIEDDSDIQDEGMPYLVFNLAVYQQANTDPAMIPDNVLRTVAWPSTDNSSQDKIGSNQMIKNRHYPWTIKQHTKLFQLLAEATRLRKKALERKDFAGVTDDLHATFRGDPVPVGEELTRRPPDFVIRRNTIAHTYPERTFNAVHSYVTKTCKEEYDALVARVLSSLT
ncbi:uncharacterized protein PAC_15504 [Phialocephala subalpina]|uniref:Uncharacterized protein n=1 Tax=Phialocephala subalpina TaxID=576137 RepID=A0A1L7XKR9_9HELO|nr:uncharacterized protein PAC_15504 [Phialocephala subalpina]